MSNSIHLRAAATTPRSPNYPHKELNQIEQKMREHRRKFKQECLDYDLDNDSSSELDPKAVARFLNAYEFGDA